MSQTEELRQMFATMLRIPPSELGPDTSLAALNTSLGGARVDLGLKRLGLALPSGFRPTTFGAMLAALSGEALSANSDTTSPAAKPAPISVDSAPPAAIGSNGFSGLNVGLDVEDIRSLPVANDYWEHEFYRGNFSRSEVAYAVLQTDPRTHFAGFWCAKEALRKCDRMFADVSPVSTAVVHDSDGHPYLTLDTETGQVRLPHALSISHTAELATAIVVAIPASSPVPTLLDTAEDSTSGLAESAPASETSTSSLEPMATAKKPNALARLFAR
jgi:phosphopantetheine--protein transferase-like protein